MASGFINQHGGSPPPSPKSLSAIKRQQHHLWAVNYLVLGHQVQVPLNVVGLCLFASPLSACLSMGLI